MNIDLTYTGYTMTGTFELIFSEPGGKVLLDTIMQANTPLKTTLRTNDSLVDVTAVFGDTSSNPVNNVGVYKGVKPSQWTELNSYFLMTAKYPPGGAKVQDHLLVQNLPGYSNAFMGGDFLFSSGGPYLSWGSAMYDGAAQTLSISYQHQSNANVYLLIRSLGLYKLFVPQGNGDTLNVSSLDTALAFNFNRQFPYNLSYPFTTVVGIPDSTDLSKSVQLQNVIVPYSQPPNVDLQLPKTPMQKYDLNIFAQDAQNDNLNYAGYVSQIPKELPFPDPSSFTIVSKENDNFSASFANPSTSTFCMTTFIGSHAHVSVYTSPDSTSMHAISSITSLNSQLLKNASLSDLVLKNISIYNVPGLSYSDYSLYINNPAQRTQQVNTWTSLTRSF